MKVIYKIVVICVVFISFENVMAQEIRPIISDETKFTQEMIDRNLNYNGAQRDINYVSLNQVNIIQIGQDNIAKSYSQTLNPDIYIYQNGENNFVNSDLKAKDIQSRIYQNGDNNFVSDFVSNSYVSKNTSYTQNGNNLTLYNNGVNSISKDMRIYQTGSNKTIYIFNR